MAANAADMVTEAGNVFLRNYLFRNLYPEWCPENSKMPDTTWTKSQIELPNRKDFAKMEKSIEAHGSDSSVVSRHYSYIKFDDIVSPGYFETPELRKKMINYVRSCFALREFPHTPVDFIGTRWHDNDAYSEIEKWENVETIKISAEFIEHGQRESIFPEFFSIPVLDGVKKDLGSYLYSALMMMEPVPEEKQNFKREWFVYFDWTKETDPETGYHKMKRSDDGMVIPVGNRFQCADVAKTEGGGDYSTSMTITTDHENNWYILDMWRDQVRPMTLADKYIDMFYYWFPLEIGIETITYELMLKLYIEEKMRREGISFPVTSINQGNKLSKEIKIKALQPMFESKCIYLPRGHALTPVLEEELIRFPSGKNDDLIDTLQMFREMVFPSSNAKPRVMQPNSLEMWKSRLKKWHKNPNRFFRDYQADLSAMLRRS